MSIATLIRRLTIDQWAAIDAEYREADGAKTDTRAVGSLMLAALLLALKRYYGRPRTFRVAFGRSVSTWCFPRLWAHLYGVFSSLVIYLLIPALFIRFILRGRVSDHGLRFRGIGRYRWVYLAVFLVVMPAVVIASWSPDFVEKYPLYPEAGNSLAELLIWESAYGLYFLALEFFFRGFMLFTVVRHIGAYAIFLMVIPYVMLHFGKPFAETVGSVIAGVALGTLSLRTGSVLGGVFIHVAVAWTMDILAIVNSV